MQAVSILTQILTSIAHLNTEFENAKKLNISVDNMKGCLDRLYNESLKSFSGQRCFDVCDTHQLNYDEKCFFTEAGKTINYQNGHTYWANKIATIKKYRERTGLGLLEAKKAVEAYEKTLNS